MVRMWCSLFFRLFARHSINIWHLMVTAAATNDLHYTSHRTRIALMGHSCDGPVRQLPKPSFQVQEVSIKEDVAGQFRWEFWTIRQRLLFKAMPRSPCFLCCQCFTVSRPRMYASNRWFRHLYDSPEVAPIRVIYELFVIIYCETCAGSLPFGSGSGKWQRHKLQRSWNDDRIFAQVHEFFNSSAWLILWR